MINCLLQFAIPLQPNPTLSQELNTYKGLCLRSKAWKGSVQSGTDQEKEIGKREEKGSHLLSFCEPSPRMRPGSHWSMGIGSQFTTHYNPSPRLSDPNAHVKPFLQGSPYPVFQNVPQSIPYVGNLFLCPCFASP